MFGLFFIFVFCYSLHSLSPKVILPDVEAHLSPYYDPQNDSVVIPSFVQKDPLWNFMTETHEKLHQLVHKNKLKFSHKEEEVLVYKLWATALYEEHAYICALFEENSDSFYHILYRILGEGLPSFLENFFIPLHNRSLPSEESIRSFLNQVDFRGDKRYVFGGSFAGRIARPFSVFGRRLLSSTTLRYSQKRRVLESAVHHKEPVSGHLKIVLHDFDTKLAEFKPDPFPFSHSLFYRKDGDPMKEKWREWDSNYYNNENVLDMPSHNMCTLHWESPDTKPLFRFSPEIGARLVRMMALQRFNFIFGQNSENLIEKKEEKYPFWLNRAHQHVFGTGSTFYRLEEEEFKNIWREQCYRSQLSIDSVPILSDNRVLMMNNQDLFSNPEYRSGLSGHFYFIPSHPFPLGFYFLYGRVEFFGKKGLLPIIDLIIDKNLFGYTTVTHDSSVSGYLEEQSSIKSEEGEGFSSSLSSSQLYPYGPFSHRHCFFSNRMMNFPPFLGLEFLKHYWGAQFVDSCWKYKESVPNFFYDRHPGQITIADWTLFYLERLNPNKMLPYVWDMIEDRTDIIGPFNTIYEKDMSAEEVFSQGLAPRNHPDARIQGGEWPRKIKRKPLPLLKDLKVYKLPCIGFAVKGGVKKYDRIMDAHVFYFPDVKGDEVLYHLSSDLKTLTLNPKFRNIQALDHYTDWEKEKLVGMISDIWYHFEKEGCQVQFLPERLPPASSCFYEGSAFQMSC